MKKTGLFLLSLAVLSAAGARADTAQTIPFLTTLLPSNETPPTTVNASGSTIVWVHVVRDSTGNITSGSVDFDVTYKFPGATAITGLHIHKAPAGVAGPILIPTDVSSVPVDAAGKGQIVKQVQFPAATGEPSLATLTDLVANPQNFYVNVHTTENPGGAIRGQLLKADMTVVMGLMGPQNETPPITDSKASGMSTVTVLRALDASGQVAVAAAIFNLEYTGFPSGTTFTGFHIHKGPAGVAGPVILNTGISGGGASVPANDTGTGNLNYEVPVSSADSSFAAEVDTINGLFNNPGGFYINTHTVPNPGGEIRSQLLNTDKMTFQVAMSPANEVPPITGLAATGPAAVSIYTLRNPDGTVAAGTAVFDINFRGFPAGTTFTGLHLHQGNATIAGPVTINTGLSGANTVVTDTGNGNVYRTVTVSNVNTAGVATLNSIVQDPSQAYVNIHTTVNPGGAIRSQLGPAPSKPAVAGVAANASTITTAAPGSIVSIFGTNLASFTSSLGNFFSLTGLPTSVNGISVTIAGAKAPIYFVSPGQINVQAPFETAVGSQPLVVTNTGGASTASNVTVAAAAPSIFFDAPSGQSTIVKNSDFSLITSSNPVKAGDVIVIYSTGLGQTTPALKTGDLQAGSGATFNNTATATVTIGGQPANVVYSIASPGFAGLYQTAVTVPSGVTGNAPVILKVGTGTSNTVNIAVQ